MAAVSTALLVVVILSVKEIKMKKRKKYTRPCNCCDKPFTTTNQYQRSCKNCSRKKTSIYDFNGMGM